MVRASNSWLENLGGGANSGAGQALSPAGEAFTTMLRTFVPIIIDEVRAVPNKAAKYRSLCQVGVLYILLEARDVLRKLDRAIWLIRRFEWPL
jgi:hypothetical protein